MKYPEELIKQVEKRCQGMHLEGINEGAGDDNATVMLVGEAPGRNEIENHVPFSGAAGKELDKSLQSIGLKRTNVYITSAVRSRPYSIKKVFSKKENKEIIKYPNRKPTKKEIIAQAPFLDFEIAQVKPKIIVAMGNTALERLLGKGQSISQIHGQVYHHVPILMINEEKTDLVESKELYTVVPEYHPAAIFYNRKLQDEIEQDWLELKKLI